MMPLHLALAVAALFWVVSGDVPRSCAQSSMGWVCAEALSDRIIRIQSSGSVPIPGPSVAQFTTLQVDPNASFPGPSSYTRTPNGLSLPSATLDLSASSTLTASVVWKGANPVTISLTPSGLAGAGEGPVRSLSMFITPQMTNVYGVEQDWSQFRGTADGDWAGKNAQCAAGFPMGNAAFGVYDGSGQWRGMAERMELGVAYFVGKAGKGNVAVYLDSQYKKEWYFTNSWHVDTRGDLLSYYVVLGDTLPDLRKGFLSITGRPLVPPKKMLGLWQSIFGYRSWSHIDIDVNLLKPGNSSFFNFPLDGIALDVYWFGGKFYADGPIGKASESTMGDLFWDPVSFPDPKGNTARLRAKGIGIMPISESYISERTKAFAKMSSGNLLAKSCPTCPYSRLDKNWWWGVGGMVDWSNKVGTDLFFDCKYCALLEGCQVDMQRCQDWVVDNANPTALQTYVDAWWLDLGEPEMYNDNMAYAGTPSPNPNDRYGLQSHLSYHNMHQLLWVKSISDGYARRKLAQRPWMHTRSGAPGMQRYGVSLWSGDIWPGLGEMAGSLGAQKHMTMAGFDYYGSDVGGFQRKVLEQNEDEKFTQWFANSCWFDVPVRPHTWQPDFSSLESSPARVGHVPSNLYNIRTRYALVPTYYSLAHAANRYGDPVVAPLFYNYQFDPDTASIGNIKMIGRDILVAVSATEGQRARDVYLPAGGWFNFYTNDFVSSSGQVTPAVSQLQQDSRYCSGACLFALPAFVRSGAILPLDVVDQSTEGVFPTSTGRPETLIARAYLAQGGPAASFLLYEDDGVSVAYLSGAVRITPLSATSTSSSSYSVTFGAANAVPSMSTQRLLIAELVTPTGKAQTPRTVTANGAQLQQVSDLSKVQQGWNKDPYTGKVSAKAGPFQVTQQTVFTFNF